MQMPLKCTGKVTKTLKMAEDSRQASTESNKITVVVHSKKPEIILFNYQGLTEEPRK